MLAIVFRKEIFVFRRSCSSCSVRLPVKRVLFYDSSLCEKCEISSGKLLSEAGGQNNPAAEMPDSVNDIDWDTWEPSERAVLCYVRKNGKILLMRKKKGLGAGKSMHPAAG